MTMTTLRRLTDDEVGILLSSAVHAPSMHNTQPWRFELHGQVVDVLIDRERVLPAEDPAGRLIRIGLGAAALNVRVAAAMLGHETTFAFAPDPARPDVVARIFLSEHRGVDTELGRLYRQLSRRHTYRGPLAATEVPERVVAKLREAVRSERAELRLLDEAEYGRLGGLLREADDLDLRDEDRLHERQRWIGGDRDTDGVPDSALGPLPAHSAFTRDLSAGFDSDHRSEAVFERRPLLAVLATEEEDERSWLRAGMALQHLLLVTTSYDLVASFVNQPLEHPQTRGKIRELIGGRHWPQVILRLGYPAHDAGHTSRRDWRESLDRKF